jgi:preprotein translocase subunit SecA
MAYRRQVALVTAVAVLFATVPVRAKSVAAKASKAAASAAISPVSSPGLGRLSPGGVSGAAAPGLTGSLVLPKPAAVSALPALAPASAKAVSSPVPAVSNAADRPERLSRGKRNRPASKRGGAESASAASDIGEKLVELGRSLEEAKRPGSGPGQSGVLKRFYSGEAASAASEAPVVDAGAPKRRPKHLLSRLLVSVFGSYNGRQIRGMRPAVERINALEPEMKSLDDEALRAKTAEFRARLEAGETLDDLLPEAFAAVREASRRVLKLRHRDVQLMGGIALHRGTIAEMATGEGKTLVAPLAVYLNALTGEGAHIFTVNDYLAKRDSEWMGSVYRFMGLSVGLIQNGMGIAERKSAYASDVTYGTASEFGFDYLRDNMRTDPEEIVQRGHAYALIDEVDSVLIDQARTPLIIAGPSGGAVEPYAVANEAVKYLKVRKITKEDRAAGLEMHDVEEGYDAVVDEKNLRVSLTDRGFDKAAAILGVENIYTGDDAVWMHYINQSLRAHHLYARDVHYLVRGGKVAIVDDYTGRVMDGRQWSEGLHQAISAKEGVEIEPETKTVASVTPQNFARLYRKLSGMTGTASSSGQEFSKIYDLDVLTVPTHKPVIRKDLPDRVYRTYGEKIRAVAEEIRRLQSLGRPVLAGTISPEQSEELSAVLSELGIEHNVLNAKHHESEAKIVAFGGRLGAVTIATNMAGRGTDILLGGDPHALARRSMELGEEPAAVDAGRLDEARSEVDKMVHYGRLEADVDRDLYARHLAAAKSITEAERARVLDAGGLAVLGTERHESRRIDLQLMGRAGRQGEPGSTQFFLSLDDKLMRLFGVEAIKRFMAFVDWPVGEPLESRRLSGSVEKAQAKVEARDFEGRDHVVKYDEVLDHQRRAIYGIRHAIIAGKRPTQRELRQKTARGNTWIKRQGDTREIFLTMIEESLDALMEAHSLSKNSAAFAEAFSERFQLGLPLPLEELALMNREAAKKALHERLVSVYGLMDAVLFPDMMREIEKRVLLAVVDAAWQEELGILEELQRFIHLRAYAQKDPLVEYKKEGFESFERMLSYVRDEAVKTVFGMQPWGVQAGEGVEL